MAKPKPEPLDLGAYLKVVERRRSLGHGLHAAVAWVLDRHEVDPLLWDEFVHLGAYEIARSQGMGIRSEILRAVPATVSQDGQGDPVSVVVVRSELRDFPVNGVEGKTRLGECTPDEVEDVIVFHIRRTIAGLVRQEAVLMRAVEKARAQGAAIIDDLSDQDLDECLGGE